MRILIVEDEALIARALREGLEAEGYAIDHAARGDDGLWQATENDYDAIVLDLMLPGMNGYIVCRELRARGVTTPIMMLTAKDGEFDQAERTCRRGEETIELTPREYGLLHYLMHQMGQVVSKRELLTHVWADDAMEDSVVQVYIGYLRRKIDEPFGRHAIETVRGHGYRLDPNGG